MVWEYTTWKLTETPGRAFASGSVFGAAIASSIMVVIQ